MLFFVTLSYREVVMVYTKAGGSYVVSRDNFGPRVAQIAAVALIIDYILTVAVQTAAGTDALTSAVSIGGTLVLEPYRVDITLAIILILTWGNLRGIREAGRLFALPTYLFISGVALAPRHRPRPRCTGSGAHPLDSSSGCASRAPREWILDGGDHHHGASCVRQRRCVADRPRGDFERGRQLPVA